MNKYIYIIPALYCIIIMASTCNAKNITCYNCAKILTQLPNTDICSNNNVSECDNQKNFCTEAVFLYKINNQLVYQASCKSHQLCSNTTEILERDDKEIKFITFRCCSSKLCNTFGNFSDIEKTAVSSALNNTKHQGVLTTKFNNYTTGTTAVRTTTTSASTINNSNSLLLFFTLGCYLYNVLFKNK